MNQAMVITNLRVPADEWHEFKNFASELDVSVNHLINQVIKKINVQKSFVSDLVSVPVKTMRGRVKRKTIWDLPELAKMPNKPMGKLSSDDQAIYET